MKKFIIFLILVAIAFVITFLIINFYFGVLESNFKFKNF